MKIGIASFAHMHAYSYAKALIQLEEVELAGIYDPDEQRGQKFAGILGTSYYGDYAELLSQGLSGIVVTSENANHKEHVLAAAKAGVHVLCEKPISTNAADARDMIEACKAAGVMLQTAFPVRYNRSVIRAKQMIDEGKLGRILAMKGTNRGQNPGGWFVDPVLSGGGAVIDHTVHVADIMRWFTGAEVKEVYAEIGHLMSAAPIDDCGILSIEFDNGVFATLDCSWSRNPSFPTWGDVTLEIVGTAGTLTIDAFGQKLNVFSEERGYRHHFWGDDMDFGLVRDFVTSIAEGKTEANVTGVDGLKALEVALAAYRSAERLAAVSPAEL